jgi:uncharacterized protein YjbI with pentapeptide repeats
LALQALVAKHWRDLCGSSSNKVIHPVYSYPPIDADVTSNDLLKSLSGLSADLSEVGLINQNLTDRVQTPLGKAVEGLRKLIADNRDTVKLIPVIEAKVKAARSAADKKKLQADLDSAKKHLIELTETARAQYDTAEKLPSPGKPPYLDTELAAFLDAYLTDQLRVDVRIQALKAMQTKMSDFIAALSKTDSNGVTPLVAMLRAQALKKAKNDGANLLNVKFVTAGGNNIIKRNIFHSSLRFSGGVVTEYLLIDNAGYVTSSGVVACYGGQLKEGDIGKAFTKQKGAMACTEDIPN